MFDDLLPGWLALDELAFEVLLLDDDLPLDERLPSLLELEPGPGGSLLPPLLVR